MIAIYNKDCLPELKRMADNQFDLAIVDPPYGLGHKIQITAGGPGIHTVKDWNNNVPSKEYFTELHRVSKNQIIWGCNYYAKYIKAVGRIVHDKKMDDQVNTNFRFSHGDLASCSLQKRITMFRYRWNGNRQGETINWKNTGENKRIHPTQKPVQLYEWLLSNYAKPEDTILDTHLGSGSIMLACKKMGFSLTGYEIDKEYFSKAESRFEEFCSQIDIFEPPV
tara:strand:+ start:442 stop:1110 length:669 start_codon:yes stop_codon:yes gene_type:complete